MILQTFGYWYKEATEVTVYQIQTRQDQGYAVY
jgi:hypothetical protein